MARNDDGASSVISDEERAAVGLGGGSRKPDEEEGLFETLGKAGDKLGETKLGQKIGSILTVIILAMFGSGTAALSMLEDFFGGEDEPMLKAGCMDPTAINYKPDADFDNGSCAFPPPVIYGCMDENALNYNPQANTDDFCCIYCFYGCMDSTASNYNSAATCSDNSCTYVPGCTDSTTPDGCGIGCFGALNSMCNT